MLTKAFVFGLVIFGGIIIGSLGAKTNRGKKDEFVEKVNYDKKEEGIVFDASGLPIDEIQLKRKNVSDVFRYSRN